MRRAASRQPVLAVVGEKSDSRFHQRQQLLLEWLPNVEPFVLPDAGHLLHLQHPGAWLRAWRPFSPGTRWLHRCEAHGFLEAFMFRFVRRVVAALLKQTQTVQSAGGSVCGLYGEPRRRNPDGRSSAVAARRARAWKTRREPSANGRGLATVREIDRIVEQLQRAYNGDAWYGPSVRAALEGVDARQAAARPEPAAHTICEIVLHMTAWTREVTRRLRVGIAQEPEDGDWPAGAAVDEAGWTAIRAALDAANEDLVKSIAALDDAQLQDRIGDVRDRALGSGVSRYVMLHGLVQHHAYHAGQISLLRRSVEPSR